MCHIYRDDPYTFHNVLLEPLLPPRIMYQYFSIVQQQLRIRVVKLSPVKKFPQAFIFRFLTQVGGQGDFFLCEARERGEREGGRRRRKSRPGNQTGVCLQCESLCLVTTLSSQTNTQTSFLFLVLHLQWKKCP